MDDREFKLHSIMAEHKKTITSLQWHPTKEDWFASGSLDPLVCVWDVSTGGLVAILQDPQCTPVHLSWKPFSGDLLVYLTGKGPLYAWDIKEDGHKVMKDVPAFGSTITQLSWHPDVAGKVAFGHLDGSLSMVQCGGSQQRHIRLLNDSPPEDEDEEPRPVLAIQWDPLSTNYLLVGLPSGHLFLLDTATPEVQVVTAYTTPSRATTVRMVTWVPGAAGTFLSGDAESGVLRVWNVSKTSPLENIHVHRCGFHTLCAAPSFPDTPASQNELETRRPGGGQTAFLSSGVRVICLFHDGGVGLYNVRKRAWDFLRDFAHTETIFDCQFKPDNYSILATASYDGSIKLWNIETMTLEASSPPTKSIVYNLSWAPAGQDCLAAGTSRSGVLVWDTANNTIKRKILDHGKGNCVYCVAWNQTDARKIASGGSDGTCMVHLVDGTVAHTFKHPGTVFGCDWHPNNENILATACEDSMVRVFYLSFNGGGPLKTLAGHKGKVFRVKWSPLCDGMLCSSSDDNTVHVWKYTEESAVRVLKGHKDFTRSVLWCPEVPHLLLSGSWDATIRIWDVRNGCCLDVVCDHGADIYGLTCHPQRPFLVASSSRDSTVRIWSMLPLVSSLQLKILSGSDLNDVVAAQGDVPNGTGKEMLCGAAARRIKHSVSRSESTTNFIPIWSKFFNVSPGVSNLWDLVDVVQGGDLEGTSASYKEGIVHYTHLLKLRSSKAHEMELVKMTRFGGGGIGAPNSDDSLRMAAEQYLALGNLRKYCDILVDRGLWCEALSLAPGVSVEYWHYLTRKRATELAKDGRIEAVQHYLALGDLESATRFLRSRGQVLDSYTLSVAAAQAPRPLSHGAATEVPEYASQETATVNRLVQDCIDDLSSKYLSEGVPVLAACCHLAINGIKGSIRDLIRGNELELALSVSLVTGAESDTMTKSVVTWLAWRTCRTGNWELAVDLLNLLEDNDRAKVEVLASCGVSLADRNSLFQQAGLKTVEEYADMAAQEEADGNDQRALQYYLLSDNQTPAFKIGMKIIRERLSGPDWTLSSVWEVLRWLQSLKDKVLLHQENDELRRDLLFFSAYLGALKAIEDGYDTIVTPLLRQARRILAQGSPSLDKDALMEDIQRVDDFSDRDRNSTAHQETFRRLEATDLFGRVQVTGSHLPRHSDQQRSFFSGEAIKGPVYVLDDGISTVSLSEAIMWARVNLLSPLGTCYRLVPF
ncbi:WD repeat-containing protein 17-like [Ornithodoros turicata]|uniref:WD repeat-containing protein 17-like n=1 Tax=Ornithodoros turicata TaxID=34597 RepID=UPI003139A26D